MDFSSAVLGTCKKRHLLGARDRVLVALSGGPDSTALLAVMHAFREEGRIAGLTAVHVDHGLRPGSAREAAVAAAGVWCSATAACRASGKRQASDNRPPTLA